MLKQIKKIRNLGLFKNFTAAEGFADFARFNLFYGWNGSGKTTLSRLFAMFGKKSIDEHYTDCEFEVVLSDDTVIKNNTLDKFTENIAVFNQQFIEDNLDWKKQGAKSIVVLSEEKMAEREKFIELRDKTIPAKQKQIEENVARVKESEKTCNDFLSNTARSIKQSYQLIDTSDKRYMNYDRTKMAGFIDGNRELIEKDTSILDDAALEQLTKKTHPIFKEKVSAQFNPLDEQRFADQEKTITRLLQTSVANQAIERLKQYQDINNWVEEGLVIHVNHESETCEFCQQVLPKHRLNELNSHFSDAYQALIQSVGEALKWLDSINIEVEIPDSATVYEEFKTEFVLCVAEYKKQLESFTKLLSNWRVSLDRKIKNVFDVEIRITGGVAVAIDSLNKSVNSLNDLISKHNAKSTRFQEEQADNKARIELHYVAKAVRDQNYFSMLQQIDLEQANLQALQLELKNLLGAKQATEALLANTAIAATQFNGSLHRFLGRGDISLVYDEVEKGYRIIRGDTYASNLSEGEKTAIAFVYFSTKLHENGNKVEDTIIVIDDPVSSFDSNFLFHSYSFLKYSCEHAKQLFVLTHNFQYFKLVRHWMLGKNKFGKPIKSQVYQIDIINSNGRQSTINNAHETLLDNNSEYQFFFRKLYSFLSEEKLNVESSYEIANYARKLLEAFLSFKLPKQRSNFYQHMSDACLKAGVDQVVIDRVFRFINVYSHDQKIEFDHSSVDNLMSEGNNITSDVLAIIEKLDETHYKELVEVCA